MPKTRELVAVSTDDPRADRFDVLIHAMAQLPDEVTLRLCAVRETKHLELLSRAYGIDDRITFADAPNGASVYVVHAASQRAPAPGTKQVIFEPAGDPLDGSDGLTLAELVNALGAGRASVRVRDDILRGERIALITNLPAPYRTGLFAEISRRLREAGAELEVFFLGGADPGRPWIARGSSGEFPAHTLRSVRITRGGRPKLLPVDLETRLVRFRPTIVVCGGLSPMVALRASLVAAALRAPFGVWSGDHQRMPTAHSRVRDLARRLTARRTSFGLAYGSLGAEYLNDLRPEIPVVVARNTSDLARPAAKTPAATPTVRLLAVGDLASRRKGVDVLVDALASLPELDCTLAVVGGGELLGGLATRAESDGRIAFKGAVSPNDVAAAYANADVFLYPSRQDVFGLALVEAMHSGLAVASSVAPGATADLCVHGVNCLLVRDDTPAAWAAVLERLAQEPALRERLGAAARATVEERWTNEHSADAFVAGLRLAALVRGAQP